MLVTGDKAPEVLGVTDVGEYLSLGDLKGKIVVLYFYPKDDTPGCTKEAQGFRDSIQAFNAAGAQVIGVSRDSVKRHEKFKAKYDIPYTLISDEDGKLCEAYGVWKLKKNYGREYMGIVRSTFLIDKNRNIAATWTNVRVKGHVEKVLEAVQSL